MKNKLAFSLIELIVVIAIVGILAAVGAPVYKQYSIRARVIKVYNQVMPLFHEMQKVYDTTGLIPATIEIGGVSVPNDGTPTVVNSDNLYILFYQTQGGPPARFRIDVSISGLDGVPGYTDPTIVGWGDTASILRFVMKEENGTVKIVCGKYGGFEAQELPSQYAPSECTCTNLDQYFFFNAPTCY